MPVERYVAELTLTFDEGDDLIIYRKVEYETYAENRVLDANVIKLDSWQTYGPTGHSLRT